MMLVIFLSIAVGFSFKNMLQCIGQVTDQLITLLLLIGFLSLVSMN